jgi:hypothetical protein
VPDQARAPGARTALGWGGRLGVGVLVTFLASLGAGVARADEPVAAGEPRLMSETGEVTTVVDAFEKDDPFDLALTLGFSQTWKSANIRRETTLNQPGLSTGRYLAQTENVASYTQSVSTLHVGGEIGLYHDLALIVRLPLILNDSRQMDDLNGSASNPQRLQDPTGAQLFKVPFKSPSRSGVDYLLVGLDWAILNQQRDFTKPTWVVGVEGRFGIGTPLHACNDALTPNKCPDPADPTKNRDPGVSRAMNGVGFHTIFSRRFGYIEPYAGFNFLAEFAKANSDFGQSNDFQGALINHPPLVGTFMLGTEIVPWEHREQFQRLVADVRVSGAYHSPGREYSELFDALGSSQAPSLRSAQPSAYHAGTDGGRSVSVADPLAQKVYFTGITDQQAFATVGLHGGATWQAGQYIKFRGGLGMTFAQSHLVTAADSCNPDFKSDFGPSGPCHSAPNASGNGGTVVTGIPNPNHRTAIDTPGRRFSVDDSTIIDLWVSGVVMF